MTNINKPTLIAVEANATPLDVLAERHRSAWMRTKQGRQEWIEGTLELAQVLAEERKRIPEDQAYGHWLKQNGLEKIDKDDRSGLKAIADDPVAARQFMETNETISWQIIGRNLRSRKNTKPHRQAPKRKSRPIPDAMKEDHDETDTFWSKERINQLTAMWQSSMTMKQIAKQMSSTDHSLTRNAISGAISRYNIPRRPAIITVREELARKHGGKPLGLTAKEVDPDFQGTPLEFLTKYGHVPMHTKTELEEIKRQEILSVWLAWITELGKASKGIPEAPDRETLITWMAKAGKSERLKTWLTDIEAAYESIIAFLELVQRNDK